MVGIDVGGNGIESALGTARAVGDLGMTVVAAGFFLTLSMAMMVIMFRWFKRLIDGIVSGQRETMNSLLAETQSQNKTLKSMQEALSPENLSRTKVLASIMFDLSVYQVCDQIEMIREQNHIEDRETTIAKIETLVTNLHEDRNSKLDNFRYRGRKLSEYTNKKWEEDIIGLCEKEVYSYVGRQRMETNVREAYKRIKIDFYKNLREA